MELNNINASPTYIAIRSLTLETKGSYRLRDDLVVFIMPNAVENPVGSVNVGIRATIADPSQMFQTYRTAGMGH